MAEALVSAPLSRETNESIFRNDILPDYLPETMRRVDRPRLILLGGQPGAGKTAVLIASHTELEQSSSTIRIVGDDLRSYHPRFLAFQRQDPETASQLTRGMQADGRRNCLQPPQSGMSISSSRPRCARRKTSRVLSG
jgi:ABC-type ATPase involved in cell division